MISTFDELVAHIKKCVLKDGDLPISTSIISELQKLSNNPFSTACQMTDLILKEPSLGTKILSVVNSAYFRRVKPILTVSEAVIALGSRQISDICSSLLILTKFAKGNLSNELNKAIQKTIFCSLLSSSLEEGEVNYISGIMRRFGEVLISYFCPEIASKISKAADLKGIDFEDAFKLIFSADLIDLTCQIIETLKLPNTYKQYLKACKYVVNPTSSIKNIDENILRKAQILECSNYLASSIVEDKAIDIEKISNSFGISDPEAIQAAIAKSFDGLDQFEGYVDVNFSPLKLKKTRYTQANEKFYEKNEELLTPIKQAISRNANTASLLLLATEIFKSSFNRVILFLKSKESPTLKIRIFEGEDRGNLTELDDVQLDSEHIIVKALRAGKPLTFDSGIFPNSSPAVCIPVGNFYTPVAVIYIDRIEDSHSFNGISDRERSLIEQVHQLINASLKNVKKNPGN